MMAFAHIKEVDVYGIFMPSILLCALFAVLAVRVMHNVLSKHGFYRSDLEQEFFDISVFFIITGLLSLVI